MHRVAVVVTLASVMGSGLLAYADAIPSEAPSGQTPCAAQKLESALTQVGVDSHTAKKVVDQLDPIEVAYFTQQPRTISLSGSLWLEEWVGGVFLIGVTGYVAFKLSKYSK